MITDELLLDYAVYIKNDYEKWSPGSTEKSGFEVSFEKGSKYIKVITSSYGQSGVHSFIVNKTGKFPMGAILKAASWKAPAMNFVRGWIDEGHINFSRIQWTGAN